MALRRRGVRGGRSRGGGGGGRRLLDRLRERKELGLRALSPLERPRGMPEGIEIATAIKNGGRRVTVVAGRQDGPDLLGWGCLASCLA
jgi:hypothetical protein